MSSEFEGRSYQPWVPQSFDDQRGEAAQVPAALQSGEDAFQPGQYTDGGSSEGFEDRPPSEEEAAADEGAPDFASLKFQRENTLLTNAESYAASIREEAELYVQQLRGEVDALNAEAERRYAEAQQAKEQAELEAVQAVSDARAEADTIRQQAYQEGYAAGEQEGLEKRYSEAQPRLEALEQILEEASYFREKVNFFTEKDGVRLAILMCRKILQQELKVNRQVVLKLLASTINSLHGQGTFAVYLNPDDHAFALAARASLEKFLGEDQSLVFRARPDLQPGQASIETDREVIDLSIDAQLARLERTLTQTLVEREAQVMHRRRRPAAPGTDAEAEAVAAESPTGAEDTTDGGEE